MDVGPLVVTDAGATPRAKVTARATRLRVRVGITILLGSAVILSQDFECPPLSRLAGANSARRPMALALSVHLPMRIGKVGRHFATSEE